MKRLLILAALALVVVAVVVFWSDVRDLLTAIREMREIGDEVERRQRQVDELCAEAQRSAERPA